MRRIFLIAAALLAGCTQELPSVSQFSPCSNKFCGDVNSSDAVISQNDQQVNKVDSQDTDSKTKDDIDSEKYTCPNPSAIPQNCVPKQIETQCLFEGKGLDSCTGFYDGKKCKTDKDCQDYSTLFTDAEKVATSGKCEISHKGRCDNIPDSSKMECGGESPYTGKQCWKDSDCIDFSQHYCNGGWFDDEDCKNDESICQANIIPPCVCWEFCDYIGTWKQIDAEHYFDFSILTEQNKTCKIGGYVGVPGETSVKATIPPNDTYELTLTDNGQLKMQHCNNNVCSESLFAKYN